MRDSRFKQQRSKLTVSAQFVRDSAPVLLSTAPCGVAGCRSGWIGDNLGEPSFVLLELRRIQFRECACDQGAQSSVAHRSETSPESSFEASTSLHFRVSTPSPPHFDESTRSRLSTAPSASVQRSPPRHAPSLCQGEGRSLRPICDGNPRRRPPPSAQSPRRSQRAWPHKIRAYAAPFRLPSESLCLTISLLRLGTQHLRPHCRGRSSTKVSLYHLTRFEPF